MYWATGNDFEHSRPRHIKPPSDEAMGVSINFQEDLGVEPKIGGKPPKMDGENNGKTY